MMKVIFGSAMTEKENFKCTAFHAIKRLFGVMIQRQDFKLYLKVTQFLIDLKSPCRAVNVEGVLRGTVGLFTSVKSEWH